MEVSSFWAGKSVLVTGAGGFTGSHLADYLAEQGAKVRAFVRTGGSKRELHSNIEVFVGDLLNEDDCKRSLIGVDVVFNVAAVFRELKGGRPHLHAVHVGSTETLVRESKAAGVSKFVHISTMGVHGHVVDEPGDESSPFAPGDDYQETKLEGELLARKLAAEIDLPLAVVRPCGIYGPKDTRFLKIIKPIRHGRFVMIGAGTIHFHPVYIDDLVRGIALVGEKDASSGEVFLIGGADKPSLNEFAATIAAVQGVKPPRFKVPLQPVFFAAWCCEKLCAVIGIEPPLHRRRVGFFSKNRNFSIDKAKNLLGYAPEVTLEQGMRNTVKWSEDNGYL